MTDAKLTHPTIGYRPVLIGDRLIGDVLFDDRNITQEFTVTAIYADGLGRWWLNADDVIGEYLVSECRRIAPPFDVTWFHWDDQLKPTVTPSTLSAREAAIAILRCTDWWVLIDEWGYWDDDTDPLAFYAVRDIFDEATRRTDRDDWHVIAWLTAHMDRHWVCANPDHEGADIPHPFNDCYADEEFGPHDWEIVWACSGTPVDLFRILMDNARNRWR